MIKFTTHSFKEKVFLKHKQNKKNDTEKRKQNPKLKSRIQLNVQPSLSRFWNELLKKQMKPSKIMETSNLRMPICTVIWNLFWTILLMGNMWSILETKMILQISNLHTVRKANSDLFFRILLAICEQDSFFVCLLFFFLCWGFNIHLFVKTT